MIRIQLLSKNLKDLSYLDPRQNGWFVREIEKLHLAPFVEDVQIDDNVVHGICFQRLQQRFGEISVKVFHFEKMAVASF